MTGYTYYLVENKLSFEQFVWTCARAFGALCMMRDDELGVKIKLKQDVSEYEIKSLEEAKDKMAYLLAIKTKKAKLEYAAKIKKEKIDIIKQFINNDKTSEENKIIEDMIVEVKAWCTPTDDHDSLKRFMLEQLTSSLRDKDYIPDYHKQLNKLDNKDLMTIFEEEFKDAVDNLSRSQKYYDEEVERVNKRQNWLEALNESVPLPKDMSHVGNN